MKQRKPLSIMILLLCLLTSINTLAQAEVTTYYFIRHAEKDRSDAANKNPNLTDQGKKRAQDWATILKDIELDAVYSTNYNRTMQTAAPTAKDHNLEVLDYDPRTLYSDDFKKETLGKTTLVVGHSNTTPAFVNTILKEKKYENIDDRNNGNLYVVTIVGETKEVKLLHFN